MKFIKDFLLFESLNNEVECICGWSWNIKNSEYHDRFICHKCGKDNELLEKNKAKDSKLWNQCVSWAKEKYDVWPSAYACGAAAKRYKSKGGKWEKEIKKNEVVKFDNFNENHGGLDKWFKEKWVDISKTNKDGSHPPCGREDADKGAYPKCRKVKVASKMTEKEKKNSVKRKRKVEKEGDKSEKRKPNYSK